ncbi:MAG TPA: glutamate-cysteine ligase family protein, partial [Sphingobium sp.]|nr:glutamate-cysteine ligase family protein [Sphingobium sp.]
FLEMRGADGGRADRITALPAFWVGLLYDQGALDAAWDLVKDWNMEDRQLLRDAAPKLALDAPVPGGRKLRDIAGQVLDISRSGLKARARLNDSGSDEAAYLAPLDAIVAAGRTHAEELLARYHGEWAGDLSRVYTEESF